MADNDQSNEQKPQTVQEAIRMAFEAVKTRTGVSIADLERASATISQDVPSEYVQQTLAEMRADEQTH